MRKIQSYCKDQAGAIKKSTVETWCSVMGCGEDWSVHSGRLPPTRWDWLQPFPQASLRVTENGQGPVSLDSIMTGSAQNNGELLNRDNWFSNHTWVKRQIWAGVVPSGLSLMNKIASCWLELRSHQLSGSRVSALLLKGNLQLVSKSVESEESALFLQPWISSSSGPKALLVFITAAEAFLYLYLGRKKNETNYREWMEEERSSRAPRLTQISLCEVTQLLVLL